MQSFLLILGLATLAAVAAIMSLARRRENRTLRELAGRQRLNFTAEDLIDLHERYYRLLLIRQGHNRFAWNLLYGSTDEGLLSLFSYRYDLGFGVDQAHRSWWVAVLETPNYHSNWRAQRRVAHPTAGGVGSSMIENATILPAVNDHCDVLPLSGDCNCIASFTVQADRRETIDHLRQIGLEQFLKESTGITYVEISGHLVSLAAPRDGDPQVPLNLLAAVRRLARFVQP